MVGVSWGVPLTWEKAWGPGPAVSTAGTQAYLEPDHCCQGAHGISGDLKPGLRLGGGSISEIKEAWGR